MSYSIVLVVGCILLIGYLIGRLHEQFTSAPAKADAIAQWFASHPRPTYLAFRHDTGLGIVEYESALGLPSRTAAAVLGTL